MGKTKVEWATHSWSPVTGCTKVSPGCKHCYAERMARRLAGRYGYPADDPFQVTLRHDRLEQPATWKKPRRIFVASMGDLFHEDVPFEFISKVFTTMKACRARGLEHTFLVLTKRPNRMLEYLKWWRSFCVSDEVAFKYHDYIWFGVSVENQTAADKRREYLCQIPAAVKFVSYEPAIAPVDWTGWEFVDQIISGGESGPGARPSHPNWHRETRDFCQRNSIAYFHKQNGEYIPADGYNQWGTSLDGEFVDPRKVRAVQVVPGDIYSGVHMVRVGKKRAGRLLDGVLHEEYPK